MFGLAPDLELVGSVENGEDVIEAVKRLRPEVVIMDVRLPGHRRHLGGQADRRGRARGEDRHVLGLRRQAASVGRDRRRRARVRDEGLAARGPAARDPDGRTGGKPFVDPSLSPALLMSQVGPDAPLSEREREILQLLAEGLHTEEVARRIGLSTETVKSDTKRAILKLEADTRVHAVAIALRQAIIE